MKGRAIKTFKIFTERRSQTACQGLQTISFYVSEAAAAVAGLAGTVARPFGPMGCSSFKAAEDLLRLVLFVSPETLLKSSATEKTLAEDSAASDQGDTSPKRSNHNMQGKLRAKWPMAKASKAGLPASNALLLGSGVQAGGEDAASFTGEGRRHMAGSEMRGSRCALPGGGAAGGSMGLDP